MLLSAPEQPNKIENTESLHYFAGQNILEEFNSLALRIGAASAFRLLLSLGIVLNPTLVSAAELAENNFQTVVLPIPERPSQNGPYFLGEEVVVRGSGFEADSPVNFVLYNGETFVFSQPAGVSATGEVSTTFLVDTSGLFGFVFEQPATGITQDLGQTSLEPPCTMADLQSVTLAFPGVKTTTFLTQNAIDELTARNYHLMGDVVVNATGSNYSKTHSVDATLINNETELNSTIFFADVVTDVPITFDGRYVTTTGVTACSAAGVTAIFPGEPPLPNINFYLPIVMK